MTGELRLVLVVPAYNEAARLDLAAFRGFIAGHSDVGCCFVDDGSTDDTARLLGTLTAEHPDRIDVLSLDQNHGKAEAVRLGFLHAAVTGVPAIGFADADLATPLAEVLTLADELDRHPGCWAAIGSRVQLLGRDIERSTLRHYLGRVFATAASLALRLPVYDTQCGLKLFRNLEPVARTFEAPFRSRWIFDVELLARLATASGPPLGERFREVPLEAWHARGGSRLRLRDFLRAPLELLAIRRRYPPTT